MAFHNFTNTRAFSEAAIAYKNNGYRYTLAPHGSRDYFQYWDEQDRRCRYGYKVGDLWIPGRMYFWLNFFPMSRVPEHVMLKAMAERRDHNGRLSITTAEKIVALPSFWEVHYEWWNLKHIAWYGGEFMGIKSPGGKHMSCLKTRGAGFSYLEACDSVYNYNFIDGSKSYIFAAAESYLIGDAIMDKVQTGLDFLNDNSTYWKKNRMKKFTLMHQKASYIDGFGQERGSMSEIIAQIVDKAGKTRGKRGRKVTFEEAGSFPNLEAALEVSLGSLREGTIYVGQASVFGTGGEKGPSIQGLENIHNNPDVWDMLGFDNIWDEGYEATECGYFVPCWRANAWFMDENGNVDMKGAIAADDIERAKKEKSKDPKDLDRRKAEYPRNPSEALQRLSGNGFNQGVIEAQIKRIRANRDLQSLVRYGYVRPEATALNGIAFDVKSKSVARPLDFYPHKKGDILKGCVSMLEKPYMDEHGKVPDDLYLITFDAYAKEQSEDVTSLWSFKVWKYDNSYSQTFINLPVAWYAGRPASYNDNLDIMFMVAKLYNAKIQGEIAGGGQSVVSYAKLHRKLKYLCHEPEMIHNKEIASKSAGNSYLMNMSGDRKALGITYLEDWHTQPRGLDDKSNIILNTDRIYDIGWLQEMLKYTDDGNFDRISDAIIFMYMQKENYAARVRKRRKSKEFYERTLFDGSEQDSATEEYTSAY